uniref:Uncharacterized protein n=1 Tax=Bracon brevicornis TaxID=1563983 RepID=A0A6V7HNK4_9HYME
MKFPNYDKRFYVSADGKTSKELHAQAVPRKNLPNFQESSGSSTCTSGTATPDGRRSSVVEDFDEATFEAINNQAILAIQQAAMGCRSRTQSEDTLNFGQGSVTTPENPSSSAPMSIDGCSPSPSDSEDIDLNDEPSNNPIPMPPEAEVEWEIADISDETLNSGRCSSSTFDGISEATSFTLDDTPRSLNVSMTSDVGDVNTDENQANRQTGDNQVSRANSRISDAEMESANDQGSPMKKKTGEKVEPAKENIPSSEQNSPYTSGRASSSEYITIDEASPSAGDSMHSEPEFENNQGISKEGKTHDRVKKFSQERRSSKQSSSCTSEQVSSPGYITIDEASISGDSSIHSESKSEIDRRISTEERTCDVVKTSSEETRNSKPDSSCTFRRASTPEHVTPDDISPSGDNSMHSEPKSESDGRISTEGKTCNVVKMSSGDTRSSEADSLHTFGRSSTTPHVSLDDASPTENNSMHSEPKSENDRRISTDGKTCDLVKTPSEENRSSEQESLYTFGGASTSHHVALADASPSGESSMHSEVKFDNDQRISTEEKISDEVETASEETQSSKQHSPGRLRRSSSSNPLIIDETTCFASEFADSNARLSGERRISVTDQVGLGHELTFASQFFKRETSNPVQESMSTSEGASTSKSTENQQSLVTPATDDDYEFDVEKTIKFVNESLAELARALTPESIPSKKAPPSANSSLASSTESLTNQEVPTTPLTDTENETFIELSSKFAEERLAELARESAAARETNDEASGCADSSSYNRETSSTQESGTGSQVETTTERYSYMDRELTSPPRVLRSPSVYSADIFVSPETRSEMNRDSVVVPARIGYVIGPITEGNPAPIQRSRSTSEGAVTPKFSTTDEISRFGGPFVDQPPARSVSNAEISMTQATTPEMYPATHHAGLMESGTTYFEGYGTNSQVINSNNPNYALVSDSPSGTDSASEHGGLTENEDEGARF